MRFCSVENGLDPASEPRGGFRFCRPNRREYFQHVGCGEVRDRNTAYLESGRTAPGTLQSKTASGTRIINRLLFKGHIIGEFVDEQIFPGYTFSWSPEPLQLLAFRSPTGRLSIMNREGQTETVGDAKDVWLPAWSESGDSIAYLERTGRKKFVLKVVSYS